MEICLVCSQQDHPIYEDEPIDKSKLWVDLEEEEEEEQEEEMDEEELEDGMEIWNTLSRYCFAFNSETPNAIEEKGIR
ncbi:unnamed protein product [Brassica rapa subsp. narinosa]